MLLTYKAKGVLPDSHPGTVGTFTGAVAEADTVSRADLIVLYGLDSVEFIPGQWHYDAPILDLFPYPGSDPRHLRPAGSSALSPRRFSASFRLASQPSGQPRRDRASARLAVLACSGP